MHLATKIGVYIFMIGYNVQGLSYWHIRERGIINMYKELNREVNTLNHKIKNGTALYFYRATPFSQHGEFNYNGFLKPTFFFKNMFSDRGKCHNYVKKIQEILYQRTHKNILLIGNQGCGKTTFVHWLKEKCEQDSRAANKPQLEFIFFDFDKNTSHPLLSEYIEVMSKYLLDLILSDQKVNSTLWNLYEKNKNLINNKINAENKIMNFFDVFYEIFISQKDIYVHREDFIKNINTLFFNQILSLITFWHICKIKTNDISLDKIKPIVFCLDNLDVLVNKEIIELFFKEYFRFVRNVDAIIQQIDDVYVKKENFNYNTMFSFIFSCRQHTWARVREHYRHDNAFLRISTREFNVTDAFDKRGILTCREHYIEDNKEYFGVFKERVSEIKSVIADMDKTDNNYHNIYNLFDDDYRQCNITFEELINENPKLLEEYLLVKSNLNNNTLNGARGIIYKAIFDKFKNECLFDKIGVLDVNSDTPLVSNARMILNYLNTKTYTKDKNNQKYVAFEKLVADFEGIISLDDINDSLIAMFRLGDDSSWNELIAFNEIHSEKIEKCDNMEIFITQAGHEYLDLIATHFEFFNTRVTKNRKINAALFSPISLEKYSGAKYDYNFQETIEDVIDIVEHCCEKMSEYYSKVMKKKYSSVEEYMRSPFVYDESRVLHGERIIHTHIRYIDQYRLYVLSCIENTKENIEEKKKINKYLVEGIEKYISAGEKNSIVLTEVSTKWLFPAFKEKIEYIRDKSEYEDFTTPIDVDKIEKQPQK